MKPLESSLANREPKSTWSSVEAFLEAIPSSILAADYQGCIRCANRAALSLFDCHLEQLAGQNVHQVLPHLYPTEDSDPGYTPNRNEKAWIETMARRPNGSLFPIMHAFGQLEIDGQQVVTHVVRDISEHKRIESALKESTDRVRAILETVPLAIVTTDQNGNIETFNLAAEPLFQFSAEEVMDNHIGMLIPALANTAHNYRSLVGGGGRVLTARRRDNSEFPVELGVGSMNLAGQELLACVIKDISDRVRAENEAETARAQLIEAEKLASLGELVAGVAHEINTPVGIGVTAASHLREKYEALQRAYQDNSLTRSSLEDFLKACDQATRIMHTNLRRASELISSFKQVAVDRSSSEQRRFGAREFIDELLLSLRPKLKRTRHRVEVDCPSELEITSYPGALSQILTNFLMNSLQHAFGPDDAGCIGIRIKDLGGAIEVVYRDNGRGISSEHQRRIFDPFFTTRRGSGGSGLGLHIVYNLVKNTLGGSIRCESTQGAGTSFVIRIPKNGN